MIISPRHFDETMRDALTIGEYPIDWIWEQGFIDQWGRFYTRREAMKIVLENGQRFDKDRNGGNGEDLYSEGLY